MSYLGVAYQKDSPRISGIILFCSGILLPGFLSVSEVEAEELLQRVLAPVFLALARILTGLTLVAVRVLLGFALGLLRLLVLQRGLGFGADLNLKLELFALTVHMEDHDVYQTPHRCQSDLRGSLHRRQRSALA